MNILDFIGNTPLFNVDNIYIKLEMFNPSGSIKDRVAKEMIKPYIGDVHKNFTVVEATSGNTGVSVAMICSALKLKSVIVCPDGTSNKKVKLMQQYGADVILYSGTIADCIRHAKLLATQNKDYIYPNQFENQLNIQAQMKMAKEVNRELAARYILRTPDAIVAGTGTGGTLMGMHKVFPEAEIYEVICEVEGLCDGVKTLLPDSLQRNKIYVTKEDAIKTSEFIAKEYGISCGYSSGANYYAACMISRIHKKILTVFPDNGIRYL